MKGQPRCRSCEALFSVPDSPYIETHKEVSGATWYTSEAYCKACGFLECLEGYAKRVFPRRGETKFGAPFLEAERTTSGIMLIHLDGNRTFFPKAVNR